MNIGIYGIGGRMGQAILRRLLERDHTLSAAIDAEGSPHLGTDAGELIHIDPLGLELAPVSTEILKGTDVCIDFTVASATASLIDHALEASTAVVIGTTGHSADEIAYIEKAAKDIPILHAPNMSLGVNLFFKLTEMAAKALQEDFDVEVWEAHHKYKQDAPSGTARRMLDIIKENIPRLKDAPEKHGREGMVGARENDEIGVMCMRGGDIVGEHTAYFTGMGERIELTHRATNRDIFARGAVTAAEFLAGKGPGLYSMYDALGL